MELEAEDYLTEKRFESTRSSTLKAFEILREEFPDEVERADLEDKELLIKLRTYKKCRRQIILSIVVIILSIVIGSRIPLFYLFVFLGILFLISSFSGFLTNRLSIRQRDYLNR